MTDELCYLCLGAPAQTRAPGYGFLCCQRCWRAAEFGWAVHHEANIKQALGRAGLLIPDRNERGLYPRSYAPPADHAL